MIFAHSLVIVNDKNCSMEVEQTTYSYICFFQPKTFLFRLLSLVLENMHKCLWMDNSIIFTFYKSKKVVRHGILNSQNESEKLITQFQISRLYMSRSLCHTVGTTVQALRPTCLTSFKTFRSSTHALENYLEILSLHLWLKDSRF